MNIILLDKKHGVSRSFNLGVRTYSAVFFLLLAMPTLIGAGAYWFANKIDSPMFSDAIAQQWKDDLKAQELELKQASNEATQQLAALKVRMAQMQARLVRLDALGERLTRVARLPGGEFDFSEVPPIGGPESHFDTALAGENNPDFLDNLVRLSKQIEHREEQLSVLEGLLSVKKRENDVFLAGRPIRKGWLSSRFGIRTDPFTGRKASHKGVDFAAKDGNDIVATASGVVTWAGKRYGYGLMIEINHGNGYSTRYGHAKEVLVKVGDIVHRAQRVGLVGSTGRSTGPHVHYEVLSKGRQVNPERYIQRASR